MTRVGIHFPQAEIGTDFARIRDFLQMAEALGYAHVNVPDHVVQTRLPKQGFPPSARYTTGFPHHEPMSVLAFAAGVTHTIKLKTAVLILPQRQATLVAKQAAEIDVLSGGRMELGVGIGWNHAEYDALNVNYSERTQRLEEQIKICRLLWTQRHVTYRGRWHDLCDVGIAPMPIQQPIPLWIGAFAAPAIRRAARLANGWQSQFETPGDHARAAYQKFKQFVRDAGRDPAEVGIEATIFAGGSHPETWAELAEGYLDCGATQLVFRPQGDFARITDAMERFASFATSLADR